MAKVNKKARRRIMFLLILVFGVVAFIVSSSFSDWKQIVDNNRQMKELTLKYDELLEKEDSLEAEVLKFQDPNYVARYAREKYLYSLPGELIIRIPND